MDPYPLYNICGSETLPFTQLQSQSIGLGPRPIGTFKSTMHCKIVLKNVSGMNFYLNGSIGEENANMELNILLLQDRRSPNPAKRKKFSFFHFTINIKSNECDPTFLLSAWPLRKF